VLPTELMELAWVGEFTQGTIWFVGIEDQIAFETDFRFDEFGQLFDGDFLAGTDVDMGISNFCRMSKV